MKLSLVVAAGFGITLYLWHSRRRSQSTEAPLDSSHTRVPVTILTGFLGSGKTTLFNHILTAVHGKRIAIIQNEFGDVGIDDRLMAKNTAIAETDEIVEVLNGCVCCSVRTDLIKVLKKLAARQAAGELCLDAIIIETTGMANPAPVAQTFIVEEDVRAFARLDGIVTLVDAKHIEQHLNETKAEGVVNESACQVAFADRLLLNKIDLVPDAAALERVEARLRELNSFAPIRRCTRSNVSVDAVLGIDGFDLQRTLSHDPSFLDAGKAPTQHDALVRSHSINQGEARHLRGAIRKGELMLHLVEAWLAGLLETHGADIYRMKGVLAIAHAEERYVFHAVHMTMEGTFEEPWAEGEPRESKLVFIGRELDPEALDASFNACLDTPQSRQRQLDELRFAVGDRVLCATHDGRWAKAEVVSLMYRDASMSPGLVAPYRVRRLKDGQLFNVEYDEEECVRKPGAPSASASRGAPGGGSHSHDHAHAGGHDHGHVHDESCQHGHGEEHADVDGQWAAFLGGKGAIEPKPHGHEH